MREVSSSVKALVVATIVTVGCGSDLDGMTVESESKALTDCIPSADQVALFMDVNYGGSCVNLPFGAYPRMDMTGFPNDALSSLKIGSNAALKVCSDTVWGGTCSWAVTTDMARMWSGWDNVVSSVHVYSRALDINLSTPMSNQVAVFTDANYAGKRDFVGPGSYSTADFMGIPNDSMSSIRVGAGVTVKLCRDSYYGGFCEMETTNQAYLGWLAIGNDTVSSLKVLPLCGQDLCGQGPAISNPSCDTCASSICASDPYCCSTYWDSYCVAEVASICNRGCAKWGSY